MLHVLSHNVSHVNMHLLYVFSCLFSASQLLSGKQCVLIFCTGL